MAGPSNEYRTLRTIDTLLLRGAGFSIAAKARKKTTRRKKTRKKKQGMVDVHREHEMKTYQLVYKRVVIVL